jgi:class 3 adenylate cyclase
MRFHPRHFTRRRRPIFYNWEMSRSFFDLIDRMEELAPGDRTALEQEVWRDFGVEMAILALDMSQFSVSVRRSGILMYLQLIRRMRLLTAPLVAAAGGAVVKYEADNMMAVFPDAPQAVGAAIAIDREFARDGRITAGIGIDFGSFLRIPDHDCFGDPVNIAYKLGEDVAQAGEILISTAARERLGAGTRYEVHERQASLSGLELRIYCVDWS